MMHRLGYAGAAALLAVMAGLLIVQAWSDSLTFDEGFYIRSGVCALTNRVIDLEPTNPPAFKLLAGASVVAFGPAFRRQCVNPAPRFDVQGDHLAFYRMAPDALRRLIFVARLPIVMLSLLLGIVVFTWARAAYGLGAGLLALSVVALEPTVLAHGHLVTGDLAVSLGIVACLAAHWMWSRTQRRRWLVVVGLALGFAVLNKVSALALLPLLAAIEVVSIDGGLWRRLRAASRPVATIAVSAWIAVCLVYLPFKQTFPLHHRWPVPLAWLFPPSWFFGFWYQLLHVHAGHPSYINGAVIAAHGPWFYYPEALALKTTLGLLLLAGLGAALSLRARDRVSILYVLAPIGVVMTPVMAGGLDMGVRYILPVYPLMAVLAGSVIALRPALGRLSSRPLRLGLAGALLVAAAVSSLSHLPDHLGYFNELAGAQPERYLSESNIDWGQDAWRLKAWWERSGRPPLAVAYFGTLPLADYGIAARPVQLSSSSPVPSILAASISRITAFGDTNFDNYSGLEPPYRWLQARRPLIRIGTSIEIFDPNSG